jgi:3-hydroxy acid dehydrogenase/malonic semialdehyde reductase
MGIKINCAFITGASLGIGAACAEAFAAHGSNLILVARNVEKLTEIANQLKQQYKINVHVIAADVCDFSVIQQEIKNLPEQFRDIDVLVNNAGLAFGLDKVYDNKIEDIDAMIDVNIKGVLYITHELLPEMLARNHGHIINIGSMAGHVTYAGGTVYCATKYAVRGISEGLKTDLHGTAIRISEVDPGMVETNFSVSRFKGDEEKAKKVYQGMQPLTAEDIADSVLYCATRPAHVNIRSLQILPTAQTIGGIMVHRDS